MSSLPPPGLPLCSGLLVRRTDLLFVGDLVERKEVVDLGSKARGHVGAEFTLLPLVLLNQSLLVGLAQFSATLVPNLVDHPQEDLFRSAVAGRTVLAWTSNITSGDIGRALDREGDAVSDLATPTCAN